MAIPNQPTKKSLTMRINELLNNNKFDEAISLLKYNLAKAVASCDNKCQNTQ